MADKLIAVIIFNFFYQMIFTGVWMIAGRFIIPLLTLLFPETVWGYIEIFWGVMAAVLFFYSYYRSKIAAASVFDSQLGFWEAHRVSGSIVRANLSYLPVIGRFFGRDD